MLDSSGHAPAEIDWPERLLQSVNSDHHLILLPPLSFLPPLLSSHQLASFPLFLPSFLPSLPHLLPHDPQQSAWLLGNSCHPLLWPKYCRCVKGDGGDKKNRKKIEECEGDKIRQQGRRADGGMSEVGSQRVSGEYVSLFNTISSSNSPIYLFSGVK